MEAKEDVEATGHLPIMLLWIVYVSDTFEFILFQSNLPADVNSPSPREALGETLPAAKEN